MLTQAKLKAIKPIAKIARHHDQHGLYLQVMPNGSKYWRLKYHIRNGDKRVEKTLALGIYPEVSLKSARENQIIARQQIRQGIDPSLAKRKERLTREHARANQVLTLARKWFDAKIAAMESISSPAPRTLAIRRLKAPTSTPAHRTQSSADHGPAEHHDRSRGDRECSPGTWCSAPGARLRLFVGAFGSQCRHTHQISTAQKHATALRCANHPSGLSRRH